MKRLLLLMLALGSPAWAQIDYGTIRVTHLPMFSEYNISSHGMINLPILVENSGSKTHEVRLYLRTQGSRWTIVDQISRTVHVGPSSSALVNFRFGTLDGPNDDLLVDIDGLTMKEKVPVTMPKALFDHDQRVCLLTSAYQPFIDVFQKEYPLSRSGPAVSQNIQPTVSAWPKHWLDYSPFDLIFLTASEWQSLDAEVRQALSHWVHIGGMLIITGEQEITLPQSSHLRHIQERGFDRFHQGFGVIYVAKQPLENESLGLLVQKAVGMTEMWKTDNHAFNKLYPVGKPVGTSIRTYFIVMLIIIMIIGPINLYWLTRKRQRIWLLVTIPIFSLLASLAVLIFVLFSEGLTGSVRRTSLTLMDEATRMTSTIGRQAIYSPLTSSKGLHFSNQTEVTPLLEPYQEEAGFKSIELTTDYHLANGWIRARIPAHQVYRKSETRRERVLIEATAEGAVKITNGLGTAIKRLRYVDGDRKVWFLENLAEGASAFATHQSEMNLTSAPSELSDVYASIPWLLQDNQNPFQWERQRPHTWIAQVERSPFGPPPIEKVFWHEEAFIYCEVEVP